MISYNHFEKINMKCKADLSIEIEELQVTKISFCLKNLNVEILAIYSPTCCNQEK